MKRTVSVLALAGVLSGLILAQLDADPGAASLIISVQGSACELDRALPRLLSRWSARGHRLQVRIDVEAIDVSLLEGSAVRVARRVARSPSCEADADVIALIVDRYFSDMGLSPSDAPLPGPPPPPGERSLHLELGAFALGHLAPRAQLGPALVLRLSPLPFLELCLGGAGVLPSAEAIGGTAGSISAWALGPSVGVGGGLTLGALRVFVHGALVLERHLGSASSELFQRQQAGAWVIGASGELRSDYEILDDWLWLSLGLGAVFRPAAPSFTIEDAATAYQVASTSLTIRGGLWVRFF